MCGSVTGNPLRVGIVAEKRKSLRNRRYIPRDSMSNRLEDSSETLDLIDRAQAGDRLAFDSLFDRYSAELHRFVSLRLDTRVRTRVAASDIVQDTQLEAVSAGLWITAKGSRCRFVFGCERMPMSDC